MNKEELIAHFQEQKKIIEKEIVFWQAQPDAEAEKPKRRHGDFGFDNIDRPCLVIQKEAGSKYELAKVASSTYTYGNDSSEAYVPKVKLGNIFDLLKEWGEDLEVFTAQDGGAELKVGIFDNAIEFRIGMSTATIYDLNKNQEIWHKLGRVISTLKRKQSLT